MVFGLIRIEPHPKYSGQYEVFYHPNGALMGEILQKEDGYYDWWPEPKRVGGYIDEGVLQSLATCLGSLNREWNRVVQEQFS